MPDIADGESVEVQGSAAKPYVLTNTGGVYSCTCPAWRNQSIGIERRTCKHLRKYRGDQAEEDRLGGALPAKALKSAEDVDGPPVLLAHAWDCQLDLTGWWISEKLDGVRAYWDGAKFLSRQGNEFMAPEWFVDGLPNSPLDGELWMDRKAFQKTISIVRRQDRSEHWRQIRFLIFDSPALQTPFEERISSLQTQFATPHPFARLLDHARCESTEHLQNELSRIESLGGEGLMARQPGSKYEIGRSTTLLKIKTFLDAEATVIGLQDGKGKHKGRMGAIVVQLPDGTEFSIGTGFSDADRENPPEVGAMVTFRYQELTDAGVPRFPSFVRIAEDKQVTSGPKAAAAKQPITKSATEKPSAPIVPTTTKPATPVQNNSANEPISFSAFPPSTPATTPEASSSGSPTDSATSTGTRRFEFTEGSSSKFWEIEQSDTDVTTRWGRLGTAGQAKTKTFATAAKAAAEYTKLIGEKTGKGYTEIGSPVKTANVAAPRAQTPSAPVERPDKVERGDDGSREVLPKPIEKADFESADPISIAGEADAKEADVSETSTAKLTPIETTKEQEEKVWTFARQYLESPKGLHRQGPTDVVPMGSEILKLPPAEQVGILRACIKLDQPICDKLRYDLVYQLIEQLLKKKLPLIPNDIVLLASEFKRKMKNSGGLQMHFISAIEHWAKANSLPKEACDLLEQARDHAVRARDYFTADVPKIQSRIDALLGVTGTRLPMKQSETWAVAVSDDVAKMAPDKRRLWTELFNCCVTATTGKPNKKWLGVAKPLFTKIGADEFLACINNWFALVEKPWTGQVGQWGHPLQIDEVNQTILRGLVWCCSFVEDRNLIRTLGALAKTAYRSVPNQGPRSQKVGNAVVFTLGEMTHTDAVTQLAMLKVKIKNGSAQRFIEGELNKTAERLGIARDDLEEMSIPAYGMDEVGLRRDEFGDFAAELKVDTRGGSELQWFKPDGMPQKSAPSTVERDFADDLKELKTAAKDIQKMVTVQRERIDSLFLQQKQWPITAWRDRYLNHPLVGIIARRLVWVFRDGSMVKAGAFLNDAIVDEQDKPLATLPDTATVELWHPIPHEVNEISQWRDWFDRHSIAQPFKQAHREVYILTDAERQTRSYSNRFAAHILRQTQLRALASARGWHAKLLGGWDGGGDAQIYRFLPAWNITAQFWINAIYDELNAGNVMETAGTPYVSTDQVRFYSGQYGEYAPDGDLVPMADVPPLVLSEVMRDVDLFVGVASIGNDPNWLDGGEGGQHRDYWTGYSFGAISETGKTRRRVLERLVPLLKIADRCTFEDNFLVVRGDIRTYRIHFGSGNIQMTPNNQYLCIVPKPDKSTDNVFLPFEGDRTLSIIISKALMLADDRKIKDPTIISQIQR